MEVIVLDDGNRGNFNQATGIAERLPGVSVRVVNLARVTRSRRVIAVTAAVLAVFCLPRRLRARLARPGFRRRPGEKACAVISAGRRLAPFNLFLALRLEALSVQVLHPEYLPLRFFDLVVLPRHDIERYRLRRLPQNLAVISGATGRVRAAPRKKPPPPGGAGKTAAFTAAVLVGGEDRNYTLPPAWAEDLCRKLLALSREHGARFLLTTSRRTAPETETVFRRLPGAAPGSFEVVLAGESDENPVGRFLSRADAVLVTGDSINMVSEAAASGRPTLVLPAPRRTRGAVVFDSTLRSMEKGGFVRLGDPGDPRSATLRRLLEEPPPEVLDETGKVGRRLAEMIKKREGPEHPRAA